ncbi:hypothetical protein MMC13_008226 [Lambiella insularis]|nr:hypothetical protein [Lambiella insularis]
MAELSSLRTSSERSLHTDDSCAAASDQMSSGDDAALCGERTGRRSIHDLERAPSSLSLHHHARKGNAPSLRGPQDARPVTWLSLPHKSQLMILAMCRLSEPLSNTCLLPYLYYLMRSLQPSSSSSAETSRMAGLVVALFALSQFATSMPWAWGADRWGRKWVIVIGLVGSIVSNLGFGFARSIPALMLWRFIAGVANGNIGVMRTMTAEIVKEKKYQSRAFLLLPLIFNLGNTIGLALGGFLADPVVNVPRLFGPHGLLNFLDAPEGVAWMREYPFALPTIVNASALFFSLLLALGGLRETLPVKAGKRDYGLVLTSYMILSFKKAILPSWRSGYETVQLDDSIERSSLEKCVEEPAGNSLPQLIGPPTLLNTAQPSRPIWDRDVLYTLFSFALLPLHNAAFIQVFPLFLSTPHSEDHSASPIFFNGGLGLPSSTIGFWLASFSLMGIMIQLLVYPRLQAFRGTLWAYRLALLIFPFAYLIAPYLSLLPTQGLLRWLGIWLVLFLQVTARTFAIPSSVILLTNVAPSRRHLGTIHGAGNMVSSLSRTVGPALAGWVLGWGMDRGCVGVVWWAYLALIAGAGFLWSRKLKENGGHS